VASARIPSSRKNKRAQLEIGPASPMAEPGVFVFQIGGGKKEIMA
jgi:hypothetical protein